MNRKVVICCMSLLLAWTLTLAFNSYYISKTLVGITYNQKVIVENMQNDFNYKNFFQVRPNESSIDIFYSTDIVKNSLVDFFGSTSENKYLKKYNIIPYEFDEYVGDYFVSCNNECLTINSNNIIDTTDQFNIPQSIIFNLTFITFLFIFLTTQIKVIDSKNNIQSQVINFMYNIKLNTLKKELLELFIMSNLSLFIVTVLLGVHWNALGIIIFESIIILIAVLNCLIDFYFNKFLLIKSYKYFLKGFKIKQRKHTVYLLSIFTFILSFFIVVFINGNINLISELIFYNDSFLNDKVITSGSYYSYTQYSDTGNVNLKKLADKIKNEQVYFMDYDNMGTLIINHNMYKYIFDKEIDFNINYHFIFDKTINPIKNYEKHYIDNSLKIKNYTKTQSECRKCSVSNIIVTSEEKLILSDNYILNNEMYENTSGTIYKSKTNFINEILLNFKFFNMRFLSLIIITLSICIILFKLIYNYYLDYKRITFINLLIYSKLSINQIIIFKFNFLFLFGLFSLLISVKITILYFILLYFWISKIKKKLMSTSYLKGLE